MDETFHESESTAGGAVPPSGDAATAGADTPYIAQFAPVEAPEQAVSPAGPPGHNGSRADGFPGGEIPESSGFSWRLPGQQMPTQQAQGGIPNEFDHLFRDAPEDDRRSLMPGQGPIGVSLQAAPSYPPNGQGRPQPPPGPQGPPPATSGPSPTQALPAAGATDQQPPVYQPPTQDQVGYQQQGPPNRAYDATGYQAQAQGYPPQGGPEYHTQAIPRVQQQPYGAGPGEPDLLLATAPGKRQSNTTILVALGVFVVLIVIAAVAFSGGGGKSKGTNAKGSTPDTPAASSSSAAPAPPGVDPEAKKQADAIYQIITQSKELRSQANGAVSNVQQCKNMPANKQTFTDVAAKRQAQADAVKGQAVDKLPGGAKLANDLVSAWQLSAESENDYVAWASDNLSCTGKPGANDNLSKANSAGTKAGAAKQDVVKDWNAFASQLGVQTIGVNDL
ncbi:MAG: hypothetical protein HOW97_06030 [Catenulispora sp.]|nr:hypothetical protein [Catenulispora sp.]